jgi:anaerobic selenocysteine-containing dehydrogenase
MRQKAKVEKYDAPAGGWGSLSAVVHILTQEEVAIFGSEILLKQNKPGGFMCVSCSWAKPANPHPFEFCENGAKATAWEVTGKTVTPEFFAQHTLTELRKWSDHQLEEQGRLTTPMRYDPASDKYLPVDWNRAYQEIGAELNKLDPHAVVMYTSGRASLEASYMYQLFGRMYGTSNFPDSSNMCQDGLSTVDACEGILNGDVRGFVGLGGNFLRAVPEQSLMEPACSDLRLSVQIATKLNRIHIVPGEVTYLLPCLGRIEIDEQASGAQAVSMEDSTACIHGSRGQRGSVAEHARSEPAIIAGRWRRANGSGRRRTAKPTSPFRNPHLPRRRRARAFTS